MAHYKCNSSSYTKNKTKTSYTKKNIIQASKVPRQIISLYTDIASQLWSDRSDGLEVASLGLYHNCITDTKNGCSKEQLSIAQSQIHILRTFFGDQQWNPRLLCWIIYTISYYIGWPKANQLHLLYCPFSKIGRNFRQALYIQIKGFKSFLLFASSC